MWKRLASQAIPLSERAYSLVPTAWSTTIITPHHTCDITRLHLAWIHPSSVFRCSLSHLLSEYEYWVFSQVALRGFGREKGELCEQYFLSEAETERCMSFYCTCLWMVQSELVFRCKCLPVLFLTGGIRRSAFLETYQDILSQRRCLQNDSLRRRPNEWAPPQIRIFLLAAISVHSERTALWERRPRLLGFHMYSPWWNPGRKCGNKHWVYYKIVYSGIISLF